jgi:hypothetical protein
LFGFQADVWDTDAETTGAVLAAHIGQAKGIIRERYGVDEVCAFDMLRLLSQESQIKLGRHCPTRHRNPGRRQLNPLAAPVA